MKKAGREISPIEIVGRKIATTFWGVPSIYSSHAPNLISLRSAGTMPT